MQAGDSNAVADARPEATARPGLDGAALRGPLRRHAELQVRLGGITHVVPDGTTPAEMLPTQLDGVPVVAALVDGRARPLALPLVGSCTLAPLTTAHWEGARIFRQSLALATLEAARQIGLGVRLGPSLGFSQRLELLAPAGTHEERRAAAASLQAALLKVVASDAPLVREHLSVLEAVDYFEREGALETVSLLHSTRHRSVAMVSYGAVFALETGPLLPATGHLSGFQVVANGTHLLLVYAVKGYVREVPSNLPETERAAMRHCRPVTQMARRVSHQVTEMTQSQQRWLQTLRIRSVGDFNEACIAGAIEPLIRVAEGFHEKRIGEIADAIAARRDETRLICIAGPSSSGKTTFIRRLSVQLQVNGLRPVSLGLDNYYVDRDKTTRAPDGEFDFESLETLQLDLLHADMVALVEGAQVTTPLYDFRAGKSVPHAGRRMQLTAEDILLVEGIHGLNPVLAAALPAANVFRVFVCPLIQIPIDRLTQVHASDLRLLRRIVRDRHGRSLSAAATIRRWPSVRRGERLHIFPYQHNADAVFDTSLVYELSVLKVYAERYLLEVPAADPAQVTAERLLELLDTWVTVYPDHVPPTSILREFIGGSGFTY